MQILVTGVRGYIGYPLFLELERTEHNIIGVDNDARHDWVMKVAPHELPPHKFGITGDLTDRAFVNELLAIHKPDVIIHLASQPSMPYSQINAERASYTQLNNVSMCLNLLWGLKENGLSNTRFIVTTTTGIPGQLYRNIPEGPTVNAAGSWYHISRGFDSENCSLASRQFGTQVIEFRTSIVYGVQTEAMRNMSTATRFDTDFYFGTALNRFVKQAMREEPITVYGKGEQTKPFISLEDCVYSLIRAIDYEFPPGHTILNQTTQIVSIKDLARMISENVIHIPNPRKENETFKMKFDNREFLKVLGRAPTSMLSDIKLMKDYLSTDEEWTYFSGSSD